MLEDYQHHFVSAVEKVIAGKLVATTPQNSDPSKILGF